MKTCMAISAIAAAALAAASAAAADPSFAFEGTLRTAQGFQVQAGSHSAIIRIYDSAAGGSALWCGATTVETDQHGRFSVLVGDGRCEPVQNGGAQYSRLVDALRADGVARWYVGVSFDGADEIMPREEIVPVPLASHALSQDAVRGDLSGNRLEAAEITVRGALAVDGNVSVAHAVESDGGTKGDFLSGLTISAGNLSIGGDLTLTGGKLNLSSASGVGLVPSGAIAILAPGLSVPAGWVLCDGQNGTPDLRGKFIYGCGSDSEKGTEGGEEQHKLTTAEVPKHSHTVSYNIAQILTKGYAGDSDSTDDDNAWADESETSHTKTITSGSFGGDKPHENRPPYRALRYIMKK